MEKVAEKAGKAAPAVAIAGALVASPAQQALAASVTPTAAASADGALASTREAVTAHTVRAAATNTYYKVRAGDTLSTIAEHFYHNASDWQWLYHENDKTVSNPDMIYPGETLFVPADPPANYTLSSYVPRHAKPAAHHGGTTAVQRVAHSGSSAGTGSSSDGSGSTTLSGTLSCSGLERLWEDAGGNPADAFMAAEIAMAESGGRQYALSPTDDYGYWQINISNGALATFNAYGNARAAVIISHDGTDWSPWTTYTSGAYAGRC
jgi:LysM repeat protein